MSSPDSSRSLSLSSDTSISPISDDQKAVSSGTIKTFDASQGQGFIRPSDGSADVQFHLSSMQTSVKMLFPGQKITFSVKEDEDGSESPSEHPIAVDVEAEDGHLEPRFLKLGH